MPIGNCTRFSEFWKNIFGAFWFKSRHLDKLQLKKFSFPETGSPKRLTQQVWEIPTGDFKTSEIVEDSMGIARFCSLMRTLMPMFKHLCKGEVKIQISITWKKRKHNLTSMQQTASSYQVGLLRYPITPLWFACKCPFSKQQTCIKSILILHYLLIPDIFCFCLAWFKFFSPYNISCDWQHHSPCYFTQN